MSAPKRICKNRYKNNRTKGKGKAHRLMPLFALCLQVMAGIGITSIMSLFFIFGHDFLTQSDYFITKDIQVTGDCRLLPRQIIEQARIVTGENLLSFNLSLVRKKLLAHPWIAEADVSRELPAGITIAIQEHEPLAVLDLDRKFLINVHGQVFKEWDLSDVNMGTETLPVISGLAYSDLNCPGSPMFTSVMEVLQQGEPGDVFRDITIEKIHVDREIGLTLYVSNRVKAIRLGYGDIPEKYGRLKKLISYTDKNKRFPDIDFIDLNYPNCIVVKSVNTQSSAGEQKEV